MNKLIHKVNNQFRIICILHACNATFHNKVFVKPGMCNIELKLCYTNPLKQFDAHAECHITHLSMRY